jgi:hypothetical protein
MESGDNLPSLPEYFPNVSYEPGDEVEVDHSAEAYGKRTHIVSMTGEGLGRWIEMEFDTCDSDYRHVRPGFDYWEDYLEMGWR